LVLKVPKEIEGEDDLFYEERIYKKYKKDNSIKYAECQIRVIYGIHCLIMEKVKPISDYKDLPKWTYYVDCQQVGYNNSGELLAYDYGYL